MQSLTLSISLETYAAGIAIAELIRGFDDAADVHLHEAKRGPGWFMTVHTSLPASSAHELRGLIKKTGAQLRVQRSDKG